MNVRFLLAALIGCVLVPSALASSHREAPAISQEPTADNIDLYAFVSWEDNAKLVVIGNWIPFIESAGDPSFQPGRNWFRYEMHIDADGDAQSDFTFKIEFGTQYSPHLVVTDDGSSTVSPLQYNHPGPVTALLDSNLGVFELYRLALTTGAGTFPATNTTLNSTAFFKPADNAGAAVFDDYEAYADLHIFDFQVSGVTGMDGRVFVGQREDPFLMNYKAVFDMAGSPGVPTSDSHAGHGVLTIALELPLFVLTGGGANPILGVWSTTSVPETRVLNPSPTHPGNVVLPPSQDAPYVQVSRLGMPLVNMVFIGVNSKDRFNALHPSTDVAEFERFFTHPALAALMGFPSSNRTDLREMFLTGIPGVNQTGASGDMLRIDTTVPAVPPEQQDPLGLFASPADPAGFPNGRRPADDVVDVELRAIQGALLGLPGPFDATDGVSHDPTSFRTTFPFLRGPRSRGTEPLCVTLTSSTTANRDSFEAVEDAYQDPSSPDRIVTAVPPETLVHFLLRSAGSPGAPTIETMQLSGVALEIGVGPITGSP